MDNNLFLQQLRDLSLEDGQAFIQEHAAELADHAVFGDLLADEALNQLYTPFVSLTVAELLIYFGEYVSHVSSHALGLKAKGDALVQIGHFQAAMECLDAAGKMFLRLGDKRNWARSRISWIISSAWLGHVEEALREADRARDHRQPPACAEHRLVSRWQQRRCADRPSDGSGQAAISDAAVPSVTAACHCPLRCAGTRFSHSR